MKKIFISYSHKDEALKDQVVAHLKAVKLDLDKNSHSRFYKPSKQCIF